MMQADVGRPRVLLADDDAGILKAISRTLATDFEVVATVTDGRKALDAVPRLDPDVVVLDISMPGLNGFQTAEELKRLGSRAKIVFLTMHQDDDFVSKAIRCGAMGYVLKTLASSDLTPALHHALAGRRYLPSLTPLVMTGADTHAVQFCGDDSSGLDGAAAVLSSALHRGDTVATVLIESNRDALALRMKERGWNLADIGKQGRYIVFDAEEAATRVMRAGRPHLTRSRAGLLRTRPERAHAPSIRLAWTALCRTRDVAAVSVLVTTRSTSAFRSLTRARRWRLDRLYGPSLVWTASRRPTSILTGRNQSRCVTLSIAFMAAAWPHA